jgi:hypothetical protein
MNSDSPKYLQIHDRLVSLYGPDTTHEFFLAHEAKVLDRITQQNENTSDEEPSPRKPFIETLDLYLKEVYGLGPEYTFKFIKSVVGDIYYLKIILPVPDGKPDNPPFLIELDTFLMHAFTWEITC